MKKLLPLITSLLIFAGIFTACGNNANTPELTEEEEYEIFYNKIAAYTWVDNNVPVTVEGMEVIENKIYESGNEIKWVFKYINGSKTETNDGSILKKNMNDNIREWHRITSNKWKVEVSPEYELEYTSNTVVLKHQGYTFTFTKQ